MEGVDPPRIQAATPNVTALMFVNLQAKKEGGENDFGFMLTTSRSTAKKKDREKECAVELMDILDRMPTDKMDAWCQIPAEPTEAADAGGEKKAEPDLAKLTEQMQKKVAKVTIEMPESLPHVMVAAMSFGPNDGKHGADPELMVLDRFDAGFGELFKEARRVSGLVRKQWFVSTVWLKSESGGDGEAKTFPLGIGMATDNALAKKRALHSAEARTQNMSKRMINRAVQKAAAPGNDAKK